MAASAELTLSDVDVPKLVRLAADHAAATSTHASLGERIATNRRRIVARPGTIAASLRDHRAILSGIASRDVEATIDAVGAHATRIYETTRAFLEARTG